MGAAGRKDLKRKYAAMEPADRASHLRSLEVPASLQEAAANVLATWLQAAELPTVEGEERAGAYRGNGTMLRFSGSFSKIDGAFTSEQCTRGL